MGIQFSFPLFHDRLLLGKGVIEVVNLCSGSSPSIGTHRVSCISFDDSSSKSFGFAGDLSISGGVETA